MKNTNWLANVFTWIYQVISEADKPISLVAAVVLPFVAPLLPALITAGSLQEFMDFDPSWTWIAVVSFELIGFLGMIAVVGAGMRLANNADPQRTDALRWNRNFYLAAYAIYLLTLISSNVILEVVNGVSLAHVTVIFCLTVGLSIAAGILNATRIYDRNEKDEQYALRQERREERLERLRIKSGSSGSTNGTSGSGFGSRNGNRGTSRNTNETSKMGRPSIHQERVFSFMEEYVKLNGTVPTFSEVSEELDLPQSTASRLRNEWINRNR